MKTNLELQKDVQNELKWESILIEVLLTLRRAKAGRWGFIREYHETSQINQAGNQTCSVRTSHPPKASLA